MNDGLHIGMSMNNKEIKFAPIETSRKTENIINSATSGVGVNFSNKMALLNQHMLREKNGGKNE